MTYDEAIERLIVSCKEYDSIVGRLREENEFLAATIEQHNLGRREFGRRALSAGKKLAQKETEEAIEEADRIKRIYMSKMHELDARISDVKEKQSDVERCIERRAERKVKKIKAEYAKQKKAGDGVLEKYKAENMALRKKNKKLLLASCACALIGAIGIVSHLT